MCNSWGKLYTCMQASLNWLGVQRCVQENFPYTKCMLFTWWYDLSINKMDISEHDILIGWLNNWLHPSKQYLYVPRSEDWLIDWCLTSSEQFFSYIQDDRSEETRSYRKWNVGQDKKKERQITFVMAITFFKY
jgi:hypothetical protein